MAKDTQVQLPTLHVKEMPKQYIAVIPNQVLIINQSIQSNTF